VPAQLLGNWFLPLAAVNVAEACPSPLSSKTCSLRLTLTATTYRFYDATTALGEGDVVVNNSEIDFFSGPLCYLPLPDGVGRYTWRLTRGLLHLMPLNVDPCSHTEFLAKQSLYRTP
jgi:hypothetical protein